MKIKEFQKYLKKEKISAVILFNKGIDETEPNFYYFARSNFPFCIVIPAAKKPVLFVSKMDVEAAGKEVRGIKLVKVGKHFSPYLKKYAKGRKIGIDNHSLTLAMFSRLKKELKKRRFVDISNACFYLRTVKTKQEIDIIKKGCMISDEILNNCFINFRKFKTEKDVASFLEVETIRRGCGLAFKPIVASGKHSSMPHHNPKDKKLGKGFCVIDFGIKHKGYCTDTTRTICIGKPSKAQLKSYNLLLQAQQNTIKSIKEGMKCSEVWQNCMDGLGKYSKFMIHGLGHGVGVEIHELPNLKQLSKESMKDGMVFTIEPGIYFQGRWGIRIEDTILLQKKPVLLTKIPKHLLIIKKS